MKNTGRSSSTAAESSAPTSWHSLAATTHDVRDAEQELLERLRVRRPVPAPAAHRRAHDERHRHLVVVHLAELRDPVHDLVEPEGDEVAEHDLEDRPLPAQRHPGGDAEERRLADRRREHAVRDTRR